MDERWKVCKAKRHYATKKEAKRKRDEMRRNNRRLRIYKCSVCGRYALTHLTPRRYRSRRLEFAECNNV